MIKEVEGQQLGEKTMYKITVRLPHKKDRENHN